MVRVSMAVAPLASLSLVWMRADRRSHPEKVKQSRLHVNCLMSQQRGSREAAHTSAQIIITDDKHTLRATDACAGSNKMTLIWPHSKHGQVVMQRDVSELQTVPWYLTCICDSSLQNLEKKWREEGNSFVSRSPLLVFFRQLYSASSDEFPCLSLILAKWSNW